MGQQVRVLDDAALREVRAALIEYADAVKTALASVEAEVDRVGQMLSHERTPYWRARVRAAEAGLANAKTAVMRKRIIAAPDPASVVDETKAQRKADRLLDAARAKEKTTRAWAVQWAREAPLYKGGTRQLVDYTSRIVPAAVVALDAMMRSIEEYERLAPPRHEEAPREAPGDVAREIDP